MHPINGKTQLIGLIGWPVSHSFSPAMHNAAAESLGLNWAYVPLPVAPEQVATAVSSLSALSIRGINVTVPHKQAVLPLLDEVEPGAQAIGAVNTIVVGENGRLSGHNTDWSGFLADLQAHGVSVADRDCLLLGAGGSARAVAYGLAKSGARVHILARRVVQAETLIADLRPFVPNAQLISQPISDLEEISTTLHAPLIVNSTPLGMTPNENSTPWPIDLAFPRRRHCLRPGIQPTPYATDATGRGRRLLGYQRPGDASAAGGQSVCFMDGAAARHGRHDTSHRTVSPLKWSVYAVKASWVGNGRNFRYFVQP